MIDRLVEKSIEAFMLGIEIYNKPTIKYRIEGFSYFVCNAWELLLKAHISNINGESAIYYKDNPDRTISISNCIEQIFTNKKDPLRKNLEKIIDLRNTSTHFITEEYEQLYVPLFQSCIFNYSDKLKDFFNINIDEYLPQNFLTLSVNIKQLEDTEIKANYTKEVADKLINTADELNTLTENTNERFSISIVHEYYITKKQKDASASIRISSDSDSPARIIKDLKDPKETHKFPMSKCIELINKRINRENINFNSENKDSENKFNQYHFKLFVDFYNLKENTDYCYEFDLYSQSTYTYSQKTIDLIVLEIKKDPESIISKLKNNIKK